MHRECVCAETCECAERMCVQRGCESVCREGVRVCAKSVQGYKCMS